MYIVNSQFATPSIGINGSAASKQAAIELRGAVKSFAPDKPAALQGISLDIAAGEMVALLGASGSGKSTLLRSLCGLELFNGKSASSVKIHGKVLQASGKMSPQVRDIRKDMAIIFQQFNLVSRLNVLQNVMIGLTNRMPLWRSLSGRFSQQSVELALNALKSVGLAELALQRASTLSGGQQQRVAIARALLQGPQILLADEPVASLDPESSERVMNLLAELQREQNLTLIVSLHNVELARRYCQRIVVLRSGQVVFDGAATALSDETLSGFYRPSPNGDL